MSAPATPLVLDLVELRQELVPLVGDHPDYAEWLAGLGIDSISLTPDSLPGVARRLAVRLSLS